MGVDENDMIIPSFFDSNFEGQDNSSDIVSIKKTFETPLSHYSAETKASSVNGAGKSDFVPAPQNSDGEIQNNGENFVYGGDENHFPSSIKFILGNEIGERYSYYAMKSILNNYLISFMGYETKTAEAIGHGFNASAYFFTLFGAYVADGRLGKFKTILYFSIVYCIGAAIFSITAIPGVTGDRPGNRSPWGLIIGLTGIAIGTGGIKPVVSAFCGDQFGPHQKKLLANLFQMFYWCVNLGSFFSSILSPILRTSVGYWVAFIIPAGILLLSIVIFASGNKRFIKRKPQGSMFSTFCKIISCGVSESCKKLTTGDEYQDIHYQDSWLDRAKGKFDAVSVDQVKMVLRVLLVFTPLPFFWALYDQTGTRWTSQGNTMNRKIGSITIDSEIIGAVNPLLVLIFVPIFEYCLYRPLQKRGVNFTLLRKMGVGMLLSVVAFFCAAVLQLVIDNSKPNSVHIAFQIPQNVILTWAEILLSITGLEFAYSNSPKNMKSIVMAGWLLTVSIGNLFDVFIISSIKASEFILYIIFGSTMFIFIGIFIVIAYKFKPVDHALMERLNEDPNQSRQQENDNNNNNNDNNNNTNNTTTDDNLTIDDISISDLFSDTSSLSIPYNNNSKDSIINTSIKYEDNFYDDPDIPSSSTMGRRNVLSPPSQKQDLIPNNNTANKVNLEKAAENNNTNYNMSNNRILNNKGFKNYQTRNRSLKNSNDNLKDKDDIFSDIRE